MKSSSDLVSFQRDCYPFHIIARPTDIENDVVGESQLLEDFIYSVTRDRIEATHLQQFRVQ